MEYVILDEYNFVIGYCSNAVPPENAVKVDTIPPLRRSYVVNGKVTTLEERPSEDHVLDKVNKCWVLDEATAANNVRNIRDALLAETDWTQLPDVPLVTKNAWAIYRQALRDVTAQVGYPFDIIWPTKPN